jgi:protein involved in temperature-dependent protein secretion
MATYSLESQQTAITTATTTTILDARAAAADEARVKPGMITIRNKGAANNTVTVIKDVSATDYEKAEFTLGADEEWVNPWDVICTGTGQSLEVVTSSTSAIDVDVNYLLKV